MSFPTRAGPRKAGVPTFGLLFARTLTACLALATAPALAAEPAWPTGPFPYTVVNQELRAVLQGFADNVGVRLAMSDEVKGTVQGTPAGKTAREFLDHLCKSYGLDWYFDGSVLAISKADEEKTSSVGLGMRFEAAQRKLAAAGVADPRYVFRPGPTPDVAIIAGPPRYEEAVRREFGDNSGPGGPECRLVVHDGPAVTVYKGPNCLPQ